MASVALTPPPTPPDGFVLEQPQSAPQTEPQSEPQTAPAPQPKSPTLSDPQGASFPEQLQGSLGDVAEGAGKEAGSTLNTIGKIVHYIIGAPVPDESKHLTEDSPEQYVGAGMEGIGEFMVGGEVLKGLSLMDRLGLASRVAKIAQESPTIGRVLDAGISALRQGTVGAGLGLVHGADAKDAAEQGVAAGAVGGVMHGAGMGIEALDPAGRAAKLYERIMDPGPKVDKAATVEVAPRLAKTIGVTASMDSLRSKVAGYLSQAEEGLSRTEDSLPADKKVDTKVASQSLRNLADSTNVAADPNAPIKKILHTSSLLDEYGKPIITSEDVPNPTEVADPSGHSTALRNTANALADHIDKIDPSIKNVIAQRRILDDGLAGVYKGADPNINGGLQAQKHAADVLRAQIAASSPEMAKANAEYSFWRKVNDVLENTSQRKMGKPGGLLNLAAAGEAGAHIATGGSLGGAAATYGGIRAAKGLIQGVPGLTGRAAVLNALASAVGQGDLPTAARGLANTVGAATAARFLRLSQEPMRPND